jgi:hypothetical protein
MNHLECCSFTDEKIYLAGQQVGTGKVVPPTKAGTLLWTSAHRGIGTSSRTMSTPRMMRIRRGHDEGEGTGVLDCAKRSDREGGKSNVQKVHGTS